MTARERFDLAVVGAGPGGYVAAIRAAQLGLRVAVVEADRPGGVCLNWGCIPSKALLTGAELVETLRRHGETFGISTSGLFLDYARLIDHSRRTADRLCKGVESLFRKNRIELVAGWGRLAGPRSVAVSRPDPQAPGSGARGEATSGGAEERLLEADHVLLATGSTEWVPPGLAVDGERVLTSREALASKRVPERLLVIGAGAVGVEFAYVYAMYGAKVTVVEMADQMLPGADAEVAAVLQREFRRKGIDVRLATRFETVKLEDGAVQVAVSGEGESEEIAAGQVLAALGRRPLSQGLGLEQVGVTVNARGFVEVDDWQRTSVPTVSAIGDLVGGALLAHKASEQGIAVAERLAGVKRLPLDPAAIPACIYAQPQVAWIGLTEAAARERYGEELRVGRFPFSASGKAIAAAHTEGFVKILAEPRYGAIVGAHVVGHGATELIAELGLALTLEATPAEVASTCHAHPTLSEAILEAALATEGRAINI